MKSRVGHGYHHRSAREHDSDDSDTSAINSRVASKDTTRRNSKEPDLAHVISRPGGPPWPVQIHAPSLHSPPLIYMHPLYIHTHTLSLTLTHTPSLIYIHPLLHTHAPSLTLTHTPSPIYIHPLLHTPAPSFHIHAPSLICICNKHTCPPGSTPLTIGAVTPPDNGMNYRHSGGKPLSSLGASTHHATSPTPTSNNDGIKIMTSQSTADLPRLQHGDKVSGSISPRGPCHFPPVVTNGHTSGRNALCFTYDVI